MLELPRIVETPHARLQHPLNVEYSPPRQETRPSSDETLSAEVVRALALGGIRDTLEVTVRRGTVWLRGHLPSYFQRGEAERIVRFLPGVCAVRNEVVVNASWLATAVRRRIRRGLIERLQRDLRQLHITEQEGVVTIAGVVSSPVVARIVREAAKSVPGFRALDDRIELERNGRSSSARSRSTHR